MAISAQLLQVCCISLFFIGPYQSTLNGHQTLPNDWFKKYLATKTPYASKPEDFLYDQRPWIASEIPKGYKVLHIDALYRHGTRFPSKQKLLVWWEQLSALNRTIDNEILAETLSIWNQSFPNHRHYTLHKTGWTEHENLAANMYKMAPQLFKSILHATDRQSSLHVLSSHKIRVLGSARAFLSQLLCLVEQGKCQSYQLWKVLEDTAGLTYSGVEVQVNASQLRPFDSCSRYEKLMHENEAGSSEYNKFFISSHWQALKREISGHFNGYNVADADVLSLYQLCAFDLALYGRNKLCANFSEYFFEVLEYVSDLKHYYKTGYGFGINYHLACPILEDMLFKLDKAVQAGGSTNGSVVLRFGHAETLIPLLCLLGLYKDDVPLTARSFSLHRNARKFRTGTFSPFAGNIALVLYSSHRSENVLVSIVLNESVLKLPHAGCHYCDYTAFRELLANRLKGINCNTVCD
ncbi:multiple inositol polyphosphate phosphatase 1-like [Ciona intestinalis]